MIRALLPLYCVFMVYGSFIPFDFKVDTATARQSFDDIRWWPYQNGQRMASLPDVVGNIVLFVPFGVLVAAGRRAAARPARVFSSVGILALVFSALVEAGQLFLPGRTSSPFDVVANVLGGLCGAALGLVLFHRREPDHEIRRLVRGEPLVIPIGVLLVTLAADRWYPFAATLDVSTAWGNLKGTQWHPLATFHGRAAFDQLGPQLIWPAFLGALASRALAGKVPSDFVPNRWVASLACVLFLLALEVGKLGFVGRRPNVDGVLVGGAGVAVGIFLVPVLTHVWPIRRGPAASLVALATVLLALSELTPFDFVPAWPHLMGKTRQIEWLPFASYYAADFQHAAFDLWNKLLLGGLVGFAVATASPRSAAPAVTGLIVGSLFEAAQLAKATRTPSVTDVLVFGAGALMGGWAFRQYRSLHGTPAA